MEGQALTSRYKLLSLEARGWMEFAMLQATSQHPACPCRVCKEEEEQDAGWENWGQLQLCHLQMLDGGELGDEEEEGRYLRQVNDWDIGSPESTQLSEWLAVCC